MSGLVRVFVKDKRGISALEYGLIAAAIAIGIAVVAGGLGNKLMNTFNNVTNSVQ